MFEPVKDGNIYFIRDLLNDKTYINIKDYKGETPLYLASYYGHFDIIELLIQHNADPDVKDNKGNTSLRVVGLEK